MKSDVDTNKTIGWIGFVLAALAGMMLMYGAHRAHLSAARQSFDNPSSWDDSESSVPVTSDDPYWGSRYAPVTIVLFSDYHCPYCKNVEETFALLKSEYGGAKLRIVWKHTPLAHPKARAVHVAAQTAYALGGQDAFWKFHELVFDSDKDLSPESFARWADRSGVDAGKFEEALASGTFAKQVDKDLAVAREVGVKGTPASFVNGVLVSGAVPLDKFRRVIDEQLQIAERALAAARPGTSCTSRSRSRTRRRRPRPRARRRTRRAGTRRPGEEGPRQVQENDQSVSKVAIGNSVAKGSSGRAGDDRRSSATSSAYTANADAQLGGAEDLRGQGSPGVETADALTRAPSRRAVRHGGPRAEGRSGLLGGARCS
jgi:protein-disulfide isomerase